MHSPESERFNRYVDEIKDRFSKKNAELKMLRSENKRLKSQLEEIRKGQSDIFSHLADAERLKLKQQIAGLIGILDQHLED
jgi:septal ring factor EnvC (AmiA/AmiB activator)